MQTLHRNDSYVTVFYIFFDPRVEEKDAWESTRDCKSPPPPSSLLGEGGEGDEGCPPLNKKKTKNKSQNLGLGAAEVGESWVKALPGWVYDIQEWISFLFHL